MCKTFKIDVDESFKEAHLNAGRQARTEKQKRKRVRRIQTIRDSVSDTGLN